MPFCGRFRTCFSSTPPEELPSLSKTAEQDASLWSSWTYRWAYPLISRGKWAALQMSDLPSLSTSDSATKLGPEFHFVYRLLAVSDFNRSRRPSQETIPLPPMSEAPETLHPLSFFLLRIIRRIPPSAFSRTWRAAMVVSARQFLVGVVLKPIWLAIALSQSFCIRFIIQTLSEIQGDLPNKPASSRWVLIAPVIAMGLAALLMSFSQHAIFITSIRAGLQARTSLSSQIFRKMLRLSPTSLSTLTTGGHFANLLVTDVQRILDAFQYFHFCWFGFIEIAVVAAVLSIDLGLSALVGTAVILVLCPLQLAFASIAARSRRLVTSAADLRVQQMHDILSAIRLVKYSAWESHFQAVIARLRRNEIHYLRTSAISRALNTAIFSSAPVFISFVTFISYTFIFRNRLSPAVGFSTIAFYAILARTLILLPLGWLASSEASVSARRIDQFLDLPELPDTFHTTRLDVANWISRDDQLVDSHNRAGTTGLSQLSPLADKKILVSMEDVSFTYSLDTSPNRDETVTRILFGLNLVVREGDLICVTGAVGSGKSTLLNGLLGEVYRSKGSMTVVGRLAYCSQQHWIVNGTLRHNITLFGDDSIATGDDASSNKDQDDWFNQVVDACCLREDLDALPAGERTEIGDRGVNLSGGQKARVALARAVYARSDIYLLDDPLAAVDAAVTKQLIERVLGPRGLLRRRTRIVATHQEALLPLAHSVVVLAGGTIAHAGAASALLAQGINLYTNIEDTENKEGHGQCADRVLKKSSNGGEVLENVSGPQNKGIPAKGLSGGDVFVVCNESKESADEKSFSEKDGPSEARSEALGKLVIEEDRKYGHVSWTTFREYVKAGGGIWLCLGVLVTLLVSQAMRTTAEVWVGLWATGVDEEIDTASAQFIAENWRFLRIYIVFVGTMLGVKLLSAALFAVFCILASRCLHDRLVDRVLHAKTVFFDTNPLGRVLNRFGKDVDQVDMLLPIAMQDVINIGAVVLGALVTISWIFPWLLISMTVSTILFFIYQGQYKKSSRELKRLDGIAYSPIYALFVQTLEGNRTIRAFGFQGEFSTDFDLLVDQHHSAYHMFQVVGRWLGVRLDYVAAIIVTCTSFAIVAAGDDLDVGLSGVAITQSLLLTGVFQWAVRQAAETENLFTSVERILAMATETPLEAAHYVAETESTKKWPSEGVVSFNNVVLKYRPELSPALQNITFSTRPRERIGIVGRTGSGKSSIIVALFRMVELSSGQIHIDGVDISMLGLHKLRSRIAIVPQDASLFNGTIRSNLDPMSKCNDTQLWNALDRVYMRDAVEAMGKDGTKDESTAGGLDTVVRENGANFSVGERQLLCLARVILSGVKIVVLDEASASLDNTTDALIQQTVRNQLANRTIITIAHRLATIADYDRILVVDAGRVVEFDSPQALMHSGGHFARLNNDICFD